MADKKVYFNKPQRLTQLIGANTTVIVAGRRTGKTDSIAAPFVLRNMQRMPGSTGGIVVPTFKHGLTNTIPGLLAAWKRWGFIEGIHYVSARNRPNLFASLSRRRTIMNTSYRSITAAWLLSYPRIGPARRTRLRSLGCSWTRPSLSTTPNSKMKHYQPTAASSRTLASTPVIIQL